MAFTQLERRENGLYICRKKEFAPDGVFKQKTIDKVFSFSFDMTFGEVGEHRNHRSGGSHKRRKGEIFANTFQGKLAECASCNLFFKYDSSLMPDFSEYGLSKWDSQDIIVNGKKISVKSTKSFGNLILLETKDWDSNGRYLPTYKSELEAGFADGGVYDYTLLIRIAPSCEDIFRKERVLFSDSIDKDRIYRLLIDVEWKYEYSGYITLDDLKAITSNDKFIIHRGEMLNGTTKMDAENYYIQVGDMRDCGELARYVFGLK